VRDQRNDKHTLRGTGSKMDTRKNALYKVYTLFIYCFLIFFLLRHVMRTE